MATIVTNPFCCTFIHIPKSGGNSVTDWLKANNKTTKVTKRKQHAELSAVLKGDHSLGPMNREDLGLLYCTVRNPWSYAVSWYTFKIHLCEYWIDQIKTNPNMKPKTGPKANLELQTKRLNNLHNLGFLGWLRQTTFKTQNEWAKDCDYVMRLERLDEDFKFIQEKLKCFKPLPIKNKTKRNRHFKDYYTSQESIDIVASVFKKDIDTYGYDF